MCSCLRVSPSPELPPGDPASGWGSLAALFLTPHPPLHLCSDHMKGLSDFPGCRSDVGCHGCPGRLAASMGVIICDNDAFRTGLLKVRSFPGGSEVKIPLPIQEMQEIHVWSLGREDCLEEVMATYSHGQRSLVGYSPWDCKRVRHNLVTQQQQRESQIQVDSCIWAFVSHSAPLVFSFSLKWRDWTRWSWQFCRLLGAYPGHLVFPFVSFSVSSAELKKEKRNKAVLGPVLYYW